MKLLYISESYIPSRTANSIHVMKMCQAFSNAKCETNLIVPNFSKNLEKGVVDIFKFYSVKNSFSVIKKPFYNIPGRRVLWAITCISQIKKASPDLVYTRSSIVSFISSLVGVPTIYEAHSPPWLTTKAEYFFFKLVKKSKNFKGLVVISQVLKSLILEKPGLSIPSDDILVCHDGADVTNQTERKKDSKHSNIGYFGHLYPGRGIEVIIHLSKKFPNLNFHIIGGTEEDINYWKQESSNTNNLLFHGFQTQQKCEQLRSEMDILLAPYQKKVAISGGRGDSSKWMSPLKIFEYMTSKKSIICSDHDVIKEVLTHNQTALLVPGENLDSWEKAISKLTSDEKLSMELGKNAYNLVLKKYTWNIRSLRILEFLQGK